MQKQSTYAALDPNRPNLTEYKKIFKDFPEGRQNYFLEIMWSILGMHAVQVIIAGS